MVSHVFNLYEHINGSERARFICWFRLPKEVRTHIQSEKQMKKEIQNIICLILSTAFHTSDVISVWNPCNPDSLTIRGALQGSSQAEGEIDGTTLDALGPLLPFLDRDSLALVDRGALALRLEEMRSFCLPKEALRDISSLFTQKGLLG